MEHFWIVFILALICAAGGTGLMACSLSTLPRKANKIMIFVCLGIVIVGIAGFISMFIDKRKAIKNKWRIPEKNLFLIAILGGSIGSIAGMHIFRHKTKHWYFKFGMPAILILQIIAVFLLFDKCFL